MRFFALSALFGLVLAAALSVPAATADSSDVVVAAMHVQNPAAAHKAAPDAFPSVNSVRMKVSPVTYAGPMGRRVGKAPSSEPDGRLESALPARGHAAPRTVARQVRPRAHAVAVQTAPQGDAAGPVAVLTRLPGTKGSLAARTCAKRLIALVERDVMRDLASRAVAV